MVIWLSLVVVELQKYSLVVFEKMLWLVVNRDFQLPGARVAGEEPDEID